MTFMGTTGAIEVFFSYAHADEALRDDLEKQLSILQWQGLIAGWHDRKIQAGTEWADEVDDHLNRAQLILLLVSPDFIASPYCYSVEMRRAMERHDAGVASVIPILLRAVDWEGAPFAKLQMLPANALPVTSWPNRDEAFLDVTKGIRKAVEELRPKNAAAPSSMNNVGVLMALTPLWNVPFRRNPFFTGREEILSDLHKTLVPNKATAGVHPLALSGLGGIGKTQTAIEYAYRYRDEYTMVLWVTSETRETVELDLCRIAGLLSLPEQNEQDQNIVVRAVKRWLETHTGWLLIFDNADDLEMVAHYFPSGAMGRILLTTRTQTVSGLARKVEIEEMRLEEGALFLLRRAGISVQDLLADETPYKDRAKAGEIVRELGSFPLAIDQAGAYIEETRCGLSGYLALYRTQRARLLKQRGGVVTDHPETVAATWSLSFQKIEQASPVAAEMLQLCAFLAPDAIPEEIFTGGGSALGRNLQVVGADPFEFNAAIGELLKYSLVRRDPRTGTFTIHHLVQAVIKDSMDAVLQHQWAERAVKALAHVFPDVDFDTLSPCQRLLSHAQASIWLIQQWGMEFPEATQLLNRAGSYLMTRAQYDQALPFLQHSLSILERTLGLQHPDVAAVVHTLATVYRGQGKHAQALSLYKRALVIREQVLGPWHPDVAVTLNNLATLYSNEERYALALPLYERALVIREQVLGPQHPDVAHSLNNLATLYRNQKQYDKAEPLYRRALAINEYALGPGHPYVATVLNNLATLYRNQKQYDKAEPLYRRALMIREQVLGQQHPDVATVLKNLAILYCRQEKYPVAEVFFQRALAVYEKVLGHEHHYVATVLRNYATLLRRMGRRDEAGQLEARAKAIWKGMEHIQDTSKVLAASLLVDGQKSTGLGQVVTNLTNVQARDDDNAADRIH